ncbi:hypothetical protein AV274_0602 [Blastocystis sp. ATCC 50177/Nand II]|uniref:UBX domain-containing protein n=1 Tax=Blastocystis sp. subtype 1 (strain ATCC 50177 / NandII) TaxID=478820 RepID=A0A196SKS8_BLAHN|nr:hypothetical protein AV274_0602 [Blastocystis sp. ATCC 50177/Nand II]
MSPISSFIIPASGAISLKLRSGTLEDKSCRVAVQYGEDRSSRLYPSSAKLESIMNNAVQFQSIAVSDGMQPALIYIRTPLVGTDLQYTLAELGWINSSVVFRLSLLPKSTLPALPPKRERAPVPPAPIAVSSPAAVSFSSADFSLAQSAELPVRLENIKTEVAILRDKLDAAGYRAMLGLLAKIVGNIIADPAADAKRSINPASAAFQTRMGSVPAGIEILAQLGFEARQTDKGERMVLDAARLSLPLLRAVQDFAGQEMRAEEANSPSVSPSVSAVVSSSAINSTNASVNTPTSTPVTPFDPTKSLVLKTVNLPEKTTLLESQVQALQERRNAFESEVPERCVVVFRAEKGVNPRNFGDAMYANMARTSDDAPEVGGVAGSSGDDAGDDMLVKEVLARKQKEQEKSQTFRTRARRELEELQRQRMYRRTTIRVHLPDRTIVQAYFGPRETVAAVMAVVREALQAPFDTLSFYLFKAPPREILKPETVLRDAKMVPAAMVYLGWERDGPGVPYPYYVKEELVQSAPLAAQIDRGAMVMEEKKKKKKAFDFSKLFKKK